MQVSRRQALQIFSAGTIGLTACGCHSAPITGRKQLIMMPETQEMALGAEAFSSTLAREPESRDPGIREMVERVGQRIATVARRDDFQWEFKAIASPVQNAFCLPGGKVAIYEGILPICESEEGLAVVMSHEIAHALARHGGERMSHKAISQNLKNMTSQVTRERIPEKHELLMQAYGLGSEYLVLLPYNRKQESEADHIGLMLMAEAGFDPREAPKFWNRFSRIKEGQAQPEFFSTHPSDERRASDLVKLMDEAMAVYRPSA
ncbi:MAG: M48 family metallopeptidase [Planctomycetota bacterium]|nr:M48 family metallopeptidase [Planctomycetota bacterium]